ncbi:MAG: hypothetical protein AAF481_18665 [Acidobacteriota bacterium]
MVRVLSGEPQDLAVTALQYLQSRIEAGDRFSVSDLVVAEAYHAFQHHYGVSKKQCLDAFAAFLASSGIEPTGEAEAVLATPDLETARPGFVDRMIHGDYLASGTERLATFEVAAKNLRRTEILMAR